MTKVVADKRKPFYFAAWIYPRMKTVPTHQRLILLIVVTLALSACHPTHFAVGNEPKQHKVAESRNNFLLLGLVHVGTAPDPKVMSNQATDYKITVKLTFLDVVLNVITLGVYSPITVQVEY